MKLWLSLSLEHDLSALKKKEADRTAADEKVMNDLDAQEVSKENDRKKKAKNMRRAMAPAKSEINTGDAGVFLSSTPRS